MSVITTVESDIKERLSVAYLTAVAARAGCEISERKVDRNGIDASIFPISGAPVGLNVQLKSTSRKIRIAEDGLFSFQIDRKTYDKLRRIDTLYPSYLVVLELPPDNVDWLSSPPPLILRDAAYWVRLQGRPAIQQDSIAVHVPLTNIFCHNAIISLLDQAHRQALEYAPPR